MTESVGVLLGSLVGFLGTGLGGWLERRWADSRERGQVKREDKRRAAEWRRQAYAAVLANGQELYRSIFDLSPGAPEPDGSRRLQTALAVAVGDLLLVGPSRVSKLTRDYQHALILMATEQAFPSRLEPREGMKEPWEKVVEARDKLIGSMQEVLGLDELV
jgi:hypothetical protein